MHASQLIGCMHPGFMGIVLPSLLVWFFLIVVSSGCMTSQEKLDHEPCDHGAQPPKSVKFAQCPGIGGINPQKNPLLRKKGGKPSKKRRILKKKGGNPSKKTRIRPTHEKMGEKGRSACFLLFWPFWAIFMWVNHLFFVEPHFFSKKCWKGLTGKCLII